MNSRNLALLSALAPIIIDSGCFKRILPVLPRAKPPLNKEELERALKQKNDHKMGAWKGDNIAPPESRQQRRARLNKERQDASRTEGEVQERQGAD